MLRRHQLERHKLFGAILSLALVYLVGCGKRPEQVDKSWTAPIKICETADSLGGGPVLRRFRSTIIGLLPQSSTLGRPAKVLMMTASGDSNTWNELELTSLPGDYVLANGTVDQDSGRILFGSGYMERDQLTMTVLIGSLLADVGVQTLMERKLTLEAKTVFGETWPNVLLSEPGYRDSLGVGPGVISGFDIYIPYCLDAKTYLGNTRNLGPFNNGIFSSTNSGRTWQMEKISNFHSIASHFIQTAGFCYYFAVRYPEYALWLSRKPIGGQSWDAPQEVSPTFARAYGHYVAIAARDTVHMCWLGRRHEKRKFSLADPNRRNYEVAYCRRTDSASSPSEEVVLSKQLLYGYSPSMSAEGDKLVIAWAGVKTASDRHGETDPNDIYYVTSRDAGKTWTEPLKVTDGAKDGFTSGKPQVVLLNGVIHLLYAQGQMNLTQESPGMTKLNQPPWPVYSQQRRFPE